VAKQAWKDAKAAYKTLKKQTKDSQKAYKKETKDQLKALKDNVEQYEDENEYNASGHYDQWNQEVDDDLAEKEGEISDDEHAVSDIEDDAEDEEDDIDEHWNTTTAARYAAPKEVVAEEPFDAIQTLLSNLAVGLFAQ
jgi:DNA repair exonuclease SbcCD ATPase subunit